MRLLVNRQTEEAVAVKVIDTSQAKDCAENVKKEVCVHKVGQSRGFNMLRVAKTKKRFVSVSNDRYFKDLPFNMLNIKHFN